MTTTPGYIDFCYRSILDRDSSPIVNYTDLNRYVPSSNFTAFTVWNSGDFGLCFEYIVFLTSSAALFGLTSAVYAGVKHTKIHRKRIPLILAIRMLLSLLTVVNSLVELVAGFWLARERPYSVLLSEAVIVLSWSVHMVCIYVLSQSISHYGRGPLTLDTAWFMAFVGCVVHLRTVLRWDYHHDDYTYKFYLQDSVIKEAYFSSLIRITAYVHFGLQCLYALTLIIKVSQVTGDNVLIPSQHRSNNLEVSGSSMWNDDAETSIRQHLISSNWSPAHTSHSTYGSIFSGSANRQYQWLLPRFDVRRLEASEDRASFLSHLSFWWVEPLMKRGAMGLLQKPEDLPQLPRSLQTEGIRKRFRASILRGQRKHLMQQRTHYSLSRPSTPSRMEIDSDPDEDSGTWEDSLRANLSSPDIQARCTPVDEATNEAKGAAAERGEEYRISLFWALNRAFGARYYPLGLLKLLADMMNFAGPLLLHQLVSFMENRKEPISHGYYYALGLFLSTLFGALLNTHFQYQVNKIGLKLRAAIITEVYRKALSVSSTTLSKFSTGQVVNFMSTDTDRIVNFGISFHMFWSLPFQIIVALVLLYLQVQLASLTGLAFCILLIPINRWLAVKIGKLSTRMMAQKDNRVKVMSEILTGIRVIKFYAWENNFIKKILRLRALELVSLKGRKYLDALCVYFWATTPVLISILTFATYAAMGHPLTAAKVFTSMALFSILISPLNAFPWVINGLVEAWVSTKRIQAFLKLNELDLDQYYGSMYDTATASATNGEECDHDSNSTSPGSNSQKNETFEKTEVVVTVTETPKCDPPDGGGLEPAPVSGGGLTVSKELEDNGVAVSSPQSPSWEDRHGHMEESPARRGRRRRNRVVVVRNGYFTWTRRDVDERGRDQRDGGDGEKKKIEEEGEGEKSSKASHADSAEVGSPVEWILSDLNLIIYSGQLVGVVGKVGSGKSSLLAAITAEMRRRDGQISVADLSHGFGLASQESWIQHATVRDNILFGKEFKADKYERVIQACALQQDLHILPAGDRTEVGENGVTLSGGQKARLALARAVYQDKSLYLLDDPLAAVDAHVASHLFSHCIMGLLRSKTRVLCTHHIRFLYEADVVIVLEKGRVSQCGHPRKVLPQVEEQLQSTRDTMGEEPEGGAVGGATNKGDIGSIQPQAPGDNAVIQKAPDEARTLMSSIAESENGSVKEPATDNVLVKEEEKEVGVVAFSVYKSYWLAVGTLLTPIILLSLFLMQASRNVTDWWLAYWVSHSHHPSHSNISYYNISTDHSASNSSFPLLPLVSASDSLTYYLGIYGGLAAANSIFTFLRAFLYAYGGICAARLLHKKLLLSILRAPVAFFDVTPIGRIINRFSSDLYAIDDSLPFILNILLAQLYGLFGTLVITCYGLPWFTLLLVPLGLLYYHIQKYYRRTSRELKRLSTVTLSPIYAHFSETLAGLPTIRALRASRRFMAENEERLNVNQRANFGSYAVAQWLGIRLQMLGVAMVTGVSFIAVLEHHFNTVDAGLVGLAISYALSVTNLLSGVVTSFTETEKEMVSVERAMQYIKGAPKEKDNPTIQPPEEWPSRGVVEFMNVVLTYRDGHPPALKGISFLIKPGEKIGVVGRTGAGKSSLFQALFRMVEVSEGSILVDGIDIATISLQKLRSALAVIPQDPFLFSGTVRENLDPCNKYSDLELWSVLERCHLRIAVRDLGGLDSEVEERGRVFSVGQRQLVCLARALLTEARVICIDEATASVDLQTDTHIQETIRSEFTTSIVITIAHRIETILNSDRILVMEQGHVKELETPRQLLDDPNSLFSALYREHSN